MATQDQTFGSLVSELIGGVSALMRSELRLAQAEAGEKASQAQSGIISLAIGFFLAFCAVLTLLQAVVIALSNEVPAWLAALIVGVVVALIALAFILHGRRNLRTRNLLPHRTMKSVRENRALVMERVR